MTPKLAFLVASVALASLSLSLAEGSDGIPKLRYKATPIGEQANEEAWISDLAIYDMDSDGRLDIIVSDGRYHRVSILWGKADLQFEEQIISTDTRGPAHVEASDIDQDGDLDILVACMGIIFPSNDKIGSVEVLEQTGIRSFVHHTIASGLDRATDVQAGDFDGDGDLDLSVALFGYEEGKVLWMENMGGWFFAPHELLNLSGAIHTPIADMNKDGHLDIVAVISQQWEEIHVFYGDGKGDFRDEIIFASTNQDYGSSGIYLCDLDRDNDLDVIYTNGDGFDYSRPGPRPYHGTQVLWNEEKRFRFERLGDFAGAYGPTATDLNNDEFPDIVVVSCFNHWSRNPTSLIVYLGNEDGSFTEVPIASQPTHLVVADYADFDGDGLPELVTGTFQASPPFSSTSRITLWRFHE